MKEKLRILVADDHAILRDGIRQLIMGQPDMEVVGEAIDGRDVLQKSKQLKPDVVLLDVAMPRLNGLEVVPLLRGTLPEARVVILSMYDKEAYVHQALSRGALGYVLKTDSGRDVIEAIRRAAAGQYFLSSRVNGEVIRKYLNPAEQDCSAAFRYNSLSEREQQIFRLVVEGHSSKNIANMLFLSPRTVEKHRANIGKKLDIRDAMAMVRYAVKIGVVDPELWES